MAYYTINQSNMRNSAPTQNGQGYQWTQLPHHQFYRPEQLATPFFGQQNNSQPIPFYQPQQSATPLFGQQNNYSQPIPLYQPQQSATPLFGPQNNYSQPIPLYQPQQSATPLFGQQNNYSQPSQFYQPEQLATPFFGQQNNSQQIPYFQPQQLATPLFGQQNNLQPIPYYLPQQLATQLSGQQNNSQLSHLYRPQQLATPSYSQQYPQQWQHGHQPATSSATAGLTVEPQRPEEAVQNNVWQKKMEDEVRKQMQEMKIAEQSKGVESTPSVKTESGDEESEAEDTTRSSGHMQHLEKYKMDSSPKGWCIIFNTENFSAESNLQKRHGTQKDVEALLKTFSSKLNFNTIVVHDPKSASYFKWLRRIARMDHSEYDCFVCVILSHGCEGYVYGTDGEKVSIDALTGLFQGELTPSLVGKPKLFFIQACRGPVPQEAVPIQLDAPATLPNESDILVSQATVSGFASCRSPKLGSLFINTLCKIINKNYKKEDLLSMLTMVNKQMSHRALKGDWKQAGKQAGKQIGKQIGNHSHTLRNKIFFNEGLIE